MKYTGIIAVLVAVVAILYVVFFRSSGVKTGEEAFQSNCTSCHLAPGPEKLPKHIWDEQVLPEMGARLGIKVRDYNPMKELDMLEYSIVQRYGTYPEKPVISQQEWDSLTSYILKLAPEEIRPDENRANRSDSIRQFVPSPYQIDPEKNRPLLTYLNINDSNGKVEGAFGTGSFWNWHEGGKMEINSLFNFPVIHTQTIGDVEYILEMGMLHPNEKNLGKLWKKEKELPIELIQEGLNRPVYFEVVDLDQDGSDEILICEYGNRAGGLSLLMKRDGKLVKTTLLPFPGSLKFSIRDMNADGLLDIVALFAQGNEGVFLFTQKEGFTFSISQLITLDPLQGTSDFVVQDMDGDGDDDIVLACGDNADYSVMLKEFHGIHIFDNQGENEFKENYFFPMYGATQVEADDFDGDGDIDIAATSFFPDYKNSMEEAFLYLENNQNTTDIYQFKSYSHPISTEGRWMLLEKGDVDQDGDLDLIMGSFTYSPAPPPTDILNNWIEKGINFVIWKNQFKQP